MDVSCLEAINSVEAWLSPLESQSSILFLTGSLVFFVLWWPSASVHKDSFETFFLMSSTWYQWTWPENHRLRQCLVWSISGAGLLMLFICVSTGTQQSTETPVSRDCSVGSLLPWMAWCWCPLREAQSPEFRSSPHFKYSEIHILKPL